MNREARRNKKGKKMAEEILKLIFDLDTVNLFKLDFYISNELVERPDYDEVCDMYERGELDV